MAAGWEGCLSLKDLNRFVGELDSRRIDFLQGKALTDLEVPDHIRNLASDLLDRGLRSFAAALLIREHFSRFFPRWSADSDWQRPVVRPCQGVWIKDLHSLGRRLKASVAAPPTTSMLNGYIVDRLMNRWSNT